jgi:hypothetical protein
MADPFRILTGMALLKSTFCAFALSKVTGNNFGRIQWVGGKPAKMPHSTTSTGRPVTLVLHVSPIERSAYRTECPDYYQGINHVWK